MPSVDPIDAFRTSLKRCLAAPDFLLDFYGLFMESSDEIREKFGAAAIGPASSISGDGLRVVRRGAQQWGPDQQSGPNAESTPSRRTGRNDEPR